MSVEVRYGDWRRVLADVPECDALICDPPYSERVIKGQRSGKPGNYQNVGCVAANIPYAHCTDDDIRSLVSGWAPRVRRWMVIFGDHYMMRWVEDALRDVGRWMFWQRVWVKTERSESGNGGTPRFSGDGPSEDVEHVAVCSCGDDEIDHVAIARPRRAYVARHRGGSFFCPRESKGAFAGVKPLQLMRDVVQRYSEPGDLIVDPFAGSGTTLLAAKLEGRRAIGAEIDAGRFAIAQARINGVLVTGDKRQITIFDGESA